MRPNVIFILADNVGYGDLGSYGGGELRGAPTPRLDQLAREGLRLTQFLVEPACTPSRTALITGRYSIREGLSLVMVPGTPNTLSKSASMYTDQITLSQATDTPYQQLVAQGPQMVEGTLGKPLRDAKPFNLAVRAEVDNELTDRSIDFIKRQNAAGKPFFLYLPFSMGHYPNLPNKEFAGKSRIGHYGDKLMEGDYHVGQVLDTLKGLGIEANTIVIFASDNGPQGQTVRELGNLGRPDMGNSGPFRGELGEATEGAIRTCAIVRWPGQITAGTTSYAMFSIMDFLPTLASIVGGKMPTDRPIDGVDQRDVLFGKSAVGHREQLLSFIGPQLVAARWRHFRVYFTDMHSTGEGPQRLGGTASASAPMAGYPRVFDIEADPHEDLNISIMNDWIAEPVLRAVKEYERSVKAHPNPPAPNVTQFRQGG